MIVREYSSWMESDTKDNATATATKAAPTGGICHYITSIAGSFDNSGSNLALVLKDGTTEIGRWVVTDSSTFHIEYPSPIKLSPNTAANLELAASGSGGTSGTAVMTGYTL